MPNHVFNKVAVTGKPEAIKAFKEKAQKGEREFSYWNFVTPPQEALDSGEYWATHGFIAGEPSGKTPNNWYNFNNREWGTKWDTYDLHVESAPKSFFATFSSAWSPPTQVFEAIVEQHPDLDFDFYWEEEQGWGGEAIGSGGYYSLTNEWDIPNSHADYVDLGKEESCYCALEDDEFTFDDCPKNNDDYQEDN
jgi:hypothetical protein